jgi:phosphotransferase family enzyme
MAPGTPDPTQRTESPEGSDLVGGRTTGARRVADTVRKPRVASTPAVHALLEHLATTGFVGAPRPRGVDDHDRQVLTYLPGETVGDRRPWPDWVWSPTMLADVGHWLRRLHDHTAEFVPPADAVWFTGHSWHPGLIIGHQDAAPWNAVAEQGRLVGFVDWDAAAPSSRERDLAFTAITWVPLFTPAFAAGLGFTATEDRARRLHTLLDAYQYEGDRVRFADHIVDRARLQATVIRRLAATGDPVHAALLPMATELDDAAAGVHALPGAFWERSRSA